MRRVVPLAIVAVLVFGAATTSTGQLEPEPTEVRVEERIGSWQFGCVGFTKAGRRSPRSPVCVQTRFDPIEVQTPPGSPTVDIVVTLTTEYLTTAGDWPDLAMRFKPEGGKYREMKRGELDLRPAPKFWDTATLTWFARNLDGAGQVYRFLLDVDLHKDSLNRSVEGRKTVVIIDVRPSEG